MSSSSEIGEKRANSSFYSFQALNRLDDANPQWRWQFPFPTPVIQVLILSADTLIDTHRNDV